MNYLRLLFLFHLMIIVNKLPAQSLNYPLYRELTIYTKNYRIHYIENNIPFKYQLNKAFKDTVIMDTTIGETEINKSDLRPGATHDYFKEKYDSAEFIIEDSKGKKINIANSEVIFVFVDPDDLIDPRRVENFRGKFIPEELRAINEFKGGSTIIFRDIKVEYNKQIISLSPFSVVF